LDKELNHLETEASERWQQNPSDWVGSQGSVFQPSLGKQDLMSH